MQRSLKTALATAMLLALAFAPAVLAEDTAPRVQIDKSLHDAGEVVRGEKVEADFVIRNEGTAPLRITNVRPACGCTVAEYDKVIEPGEKGTISAVLDTTTLTGGTSKGITVFTNDPQNPRLNLTMAVKIQEYLIFNPGFARFGRGHGHQPGVVPQIFYAPEFDELEILEVKSPFPYLSATFRPATDEEKRSDGGDKQYVFDITMNYDDAPVGPVIGQVEVHTNHPKQKVTQLPVSGFVRPRMAVTPEVADFQQVEVQEPLTQRLLVNNFTADEVKVTKVESDVPGIETAIATLQEGRRYSVDITLTPEMAKGDFSGMVRIHTDDEKKPVIEVKVQGQVL